MRLLHNINGDSSIHAEYRRSDQESLQREGSLLEHLRRANSTIFSWIHVRFSIIKILGKKNTLSLHRCCFVSKAQPRAIIAVNKSLP
jgi:hypothetical protein